jgi:hypothetical protein
MAFHEDPDLATGLLLGSLYGSYDLLLFGLSKKLFFSQKRDFQCGKFYVFKRGCRRLPAARKFIYLILNSISGAFSLPGFDL